MSSSRWWVGAALALCLTFSGSVAHVEEAATSASETAADIEEPMPEVLTYAELMELSVEKREAYVKMLGEVLVEIAELSQEGKEPMVSQEMHNELQRRFEFLLTMIPEANAQQAPNCTVPNGGFKNAADICLPLPKTTWNGGFDARCPDNKFAIFYQAAVGTCVLPHKFEHDKGCPTGFQHVSVKSNIVGQPGTYYCIPNASWNQLYEKRQKELKATGGAQPANAKNEAELRQIVKFPTPPPPPPSKCVVPAGGFKNAADVCPMEPTRSFTGALDIQCAKNNFNIRFQPYVGTCVLPHKFEHDKGCPKDFWHVSVKSVIAGQPATYYCVPNASWNLLSEQRQNELTATGGAEPLKAETVAEVQRTALGALPTCKYSNRKCDGVAFEKSGGVDQWRNKMRDRTNCIFAGNISSYASAVKAKGTCRPVKEFRYSATAKPLSCGEGQVICNPLIFGVEQTADGQGKPICVPGKGAATAACDKQSGQLERARKLKPDFLNQNVNGIANAWNDFAKRLLSVCDAKTSGTFFCVECNVLLSRLKAMNAFGKGQSCNVVKDWNHFRPANRGTQPAVGNGKTR